MINNHIRCVVCDVITHQCHIFNTGLLKLPRKLAWMSDHLAAVRGCDWLVIQFYANVITYPYLNPKTGLVSYTGDYGVIGTSYTASVV